METFKKGDVVICKKCEVRERLIFDAKGMRVENYIDDSCFNREAVIEYTRRESKLACGFENPEDKDEYSIRFLDDNSSLAWVSASDLISKVKKTRIISQICGVRENEDKCPCGECGHQN